MSVNEYSPYFNHLDRSEGSCQIINDQTRKNFFGRTCLSAENTTFEESVFAKDIFFNRVVGLTTVNCNGYLEAKNCQLNEVFVGLKANLSETTAKSIKVLFGELVWVHSKLGVVCAETIKVERGISLDGITCRETVSCTSGKIQAKNSLLGIVEASKDIDLTDCCCQEVKSLNGGLKIESRIAGRGLFYSLSAQNDISLKGSIVTDNVAALLGKVTAENCQLNRISCEYDIHLENSSLNSCYTRIGSLFIKATSQLMYRKLHAGKDIVLINAKVEKYVRTKNGAIYATDCKLPAIKAAEEIKLVSSHCDSARLVVTSNQGIVTLKSSIIEGDLVIEIDKYFEVRGALRKVTSDEPSIKLIGSKFQIFVNDFSDLENLMKGDIVLENGGIGLINGQPYKYVDGDFVALFSENDQSTLSDEIKVEIRGNGVIKGQVILQGDCKYTLSPDISVGSITVR